VEDPRGSGVDVGGLCIIGLVISRKGVVVWKNCRILPTPLSSPVGFFFRGIFCRAQTRESPKKNGGKSKGFLYFFLFSKI
jgi:hypothetical protein